MQFKRREHILNTVLSDGQDCKCNLAEKQHNTEMLTEQSLPNKSVISKAGFLVLK